METIRQPFYVSLVVLAVGILMFVAWWVIPAQEAINARFLHGLLFGVATLLISVGGFASFCMGMVFLVNLFVEPRGKAKAARAR